MKHDCPYCGAKLGWRLVTSRPLPGERKILPNQAVAVCPSCGGRLASNNHWSELAFLGIVGLPCFIFPTLKASFGKQELIYVGGGALLVCLAAWLFFHVRYWRHLQRYRAYVPPPAR